MKEVSVEQILFATKGTLLCGSKDAVIRNIVIDSREQTQDALFVPIVGEKTDGHKYAKGAIQNGATVLFMKQDSEYRENVLASAAEADAVVIAVTDTIKALQDLAAWYRGRFSLPLIGITGSVGKTTTKEMIAAALETEKKVLKTIGNKNSQIGLPLMMFYLDEEHEAAVIEMGMSEAGEMKNLAYVAKPDCAVMTNIGVAHIAQLGSKENIRKEKLCIANEFLPDSYLFVNGNDSLLNETATQITQKQITIDCNGETKAALEKAKAVTYGIGEGFTYGAKNLVTGVDGIGFTLVVNDGEVQKKLPVQLKVFGNHNVMNALAAFAVAGWLGISPESAKRGLEQYEPIAMRGQTVEKNGVLWIDDTYNASPDSMKSGAQVLVSMKGERHLAVFADVLELGEQSEALHREVGAYLAKNPSLGKQPDVLVTVGTQAAFIAEEAKASGLQEVFEFLSNAEAITWLKRNLRAGDVVLVKGSRGMHTEEIIKAFD